MVSLRIFIGCSSRDDIDEKYFSLAGEVFKKLSSHHIIIGGTLVGMMGKVGDSAKDFSQIILKDYVEDEDLKSLKADVCETSFERLKLIWEQADLFVFLPGGTGTLGEIITFLEENRCKSQKKKIIVLNYQGFYDEIVSFVKKASLLKFCNASILEGLIIVSSVDELLEEVR